MKPPTKPGRERVDAIALPVAVIALLVVVVAVGEALSLANVPKVVPSLTPPPVLSGAELTATQAQLATAGANEHIMAVTLAAVMQVTPGAVALGVSAPGTVPAPGNATDFASQNAWVGLVGGEWASVYAGALRSAPQTGALLLVTVTAGRVNQQRFDVPLSEGALLIRAANDQRLTVVSGGGFTYYFDVLAERFVSSLTEYAETATPSIVTATTGVTATATLSGTLTPTP